MKKDMNPSLVAYFFMKSSPSFYLYPFTYFSYICSLQHIHLLERCQQGIRILRLFQPLRHSLSQSWQWLSCFFSFKGFFTFHFLWFRLFLRFLLLLFYSFRSLYCLLNWFWSLCFLLRFWFAFSFWWRWWRGRFGSININIEECFSHIKIVALINMIFGKDSCIWAFYFNSDFIGLDVGDSLILINPFSLL